MMKSGASNIRDKLNQTKKIEKKKIKKIIKEKFKRYRKKKIKKRKKKRKKNLLSVVLDKICVFCLYPIPDFSAIRKEGQL